MRPIPTVVATGVHMERVKPRFFQKPGHSEPLLNVAARFHIFFARQSSSTETLDVVLEAKPILNGETLAYPPLYFPQDFNGKIQAMSKVSAVLIGSMIP
jgi:hypothetical protein